MDDKTLKNANKILIKFITDIDAKVQYGLKQRKLMFEQIEKGIQPTGYRIDFINQSVREIFDLLLKRAKDFNEKHPQDRLSTEDFMDILATAQHRINIKVSE